MEKTKINHDLGIMKSLAEWCKFDHSRPRDDQSQMKRYVELILSPSTFNLAQYAHYLEQTYNSKLPASWAGSNSNGTYSNGYSNGGPRKYTNGFTNGNGAQARLTQAYLEGKSVRTVYGLVPLKYALDWPVFASYDELAGCANWMGGRIPTADEVRSIYSHVDGLKRKEAERQLSNTVPAVNRYVASAIGILPMTKSSATWSMTVSRRALHQERTTKVKARRSFSPTLGEPT